VTGDSKGRHYATPGFIYGVPICCSDFAGERGAARCEALVTSSLFAFPL